MDETYEKFEAALRKIIHESDKAWTDKLKELVENVDKTLLIELGSWLCSDEAEHLFG